VRVPGAAPADQRAVADALFCVFADEVPAGLLPLVEVADDDGVIVAEELLPI